MNWLKSFLCAHRYEWMRNIYGDEINLSGGTGRVAWFQARDIMRLPAPRSRWPVHHALAGPPPQHQ